MEINEWNYGKGVCAMLEKYTFFGLPADLIAWLMLFTVLLAGIIWMAVKAR